MRLPVFRLLEGVPQRTTQKEDVEDFEKAKESVIQLLAEDIDMRLILEIYKEEPQQIAV